MRKPLLIAALAAIFAIAAYTGYWFYARGMALEAIANWVAQQRDAGYRIEHNPPITNGYPFLLKFKINSVSAAAADDSWHWRGEALGVEIRPWNFHRVRLEAFGAQHFMLRQAGAAIRIVLDARESVAVATLAASGRLTGAKLRIQDMRLTGDTGEFRADEFWLEAAIAETPPQNHTDPSLTLSLAAADAVLPAAFDSALGREIKTLRADFKVLGAIPRGPLGEAVESWRRDGGTIEVEWLHLVWGATDLRATGTLALDDAHRPLGALAADIRGYGAALEALRTASVVSDSVANLAKIGLAQLARKPPGGGAPVLSVPVTAQSGKLYVGPVKIANLPRLPLSVRSR